jgi:hypothetical protein
MAEKLSASQIGLCSMESIMVRYLGNMRDTKQLPIDYDTYTIATLISLQQSGPAVRQQSLLCDATDNGHNPTQTGCWVSTRTIT